MTHPSLMPWGPGKPVRLTGGLARVMIIEEMRGRSVRCSWMAFGRMHSDWFCLSGLVPAHAVDRTTTEPNGVRSGPIGTYPRYAREERRNSRRLVAEDGR